MNSLEGMRSEMPSVYLSSPAGGALKAGLLVAGRCLSVCLSVPKGCSPLPPSLPRVAARDAPAWPIPSWGTLVNALVQHTLPISSRPPPQHHQTKMPPWAQGGMKRPPGARLHVGAATGEASPILRLCKSLSDWQRFHFTTEERENCFVRTTATQKPSRAATEPGCTQGAALCKCPPRPRRLPASTEQNTESSLLSSEHQESFLLLSHRA